MKFGKEIQSQQIPGWSQYYLDYKGLKKIISAAHKSISATDSPAIEVMRPSDVLTATGIGSSQRSSLPASEILSPAVVLSASGVLTGDVVEPLAIPTVGDEEARGPEFQRSKALFFFKLERELEKINSFYLQKEEELKIRLATLLTKRRIARQRSNGTPDGTHEVDGVEWRAVLEGFRSLDKDLRKLQQFIELNATGFRKILKKWDKRSKSRTKELYLARQVEVQPCFDRKLIGELSDTVAACLLDPESGGVVDPVAEAQGPDGIFQHQLALEASAQQSQPLRDFEGNLLKAVTISDEATVLELLNLAEGSLARNEGDRTHVMRVLWRAALPAQVNIADIIINSKPFDLAFVDDINGRTSLHEAAVAGELRLVSLCLAHGVAVNRQDAYGRTALHYASIHGHDVLSQHLLRAGADPNIADMDNQTPLIYAIVNGRLACVQTLIDIGKVGIDAPSSSNLVPLSLAAQYGHLDIVMLFLEHGAVGLPNTNGEYPIHLAAQEGHCEVCRLLASQPNGGQKDIPDKYNEWTPLFHAARNGHDDCVLILLEANVNPHAIDEVGRTAVFYSSWHGHVKCTNRLLHAMTSSPSSQSFISSPSTRVAAPSQSSKSPFSEPYISPLEPQSIGSTQEQDMDVDIPSLSLPPPIMPFRIYGHNYLDKMYLLQIALGHPFTPDPSVSAGSPSPVRLLPNSMPGAENSLPRPASKSRSNVPSMKVVMTLRPNETDADGTLTSSHSTTLPLGDPSEVFSFQTRGLDDITLEFSFYPTFGSKAIGRAVASPQTLRDRRSANPRTIPILDHRLHVIGQLSFESFLVAPFSEVALEIGGTVETYWKSTAVPSIDLFSGGTPSRATSTTSPDIRSPSYSVNAAAANIVTLSSLSGEFVHAIVQVTRDGIPVVFPDWNLPVQDNQFDIGVADVTKDQFVDLAHKLGRSMGSDTVGVSSASAWHRTLSMKMCTLEEVLQVLPPSFGLSIDLRYPNPVIRDRYHLGHHHEPNAFVDAVLGTVYSVSQSLPQLSSRRKIVFSSFVPAICVATNWKQPNYAVFFSSKCGVARGSNPLTPEQGLLADEEESDNRCRSVCAAVQFAKSNNLLGVLLNANLLAAIPSLVQGIKEHGVLLAAFGSQAQLAKLNSVFAGSTADAPRIDATLKDGVLSYIDHVLQPSS